MDGPTREAARELLGRTAELPRSRRGLLALLSEYRAALFDLIAADDADTYLFSAISCSTPPRLAQAIWSR